jgi:RNA polymerase sigma-70 factor, ECF subfamily
MTENASDGELVRRIARRGSDPAVARDAETELCRRFAPRVRLYGLRHLQREDRAADLVQAVLLALLEAARQQRIEEPDHVERFVLGTSRHIARSLQKGEARTRPVEPQELDVGAFVPAVEPIDVAALTRCFAKLDERARKVMLLSFQTESATDEIAALTATSAGNVRVVRHRALLQLRRCLDGEGADA